MFSVLFKIQKKIAQLINEEPEDNDALNELVLFVNALSIWEIVERPGESVTIVRHKKTLKEV